MSAPSWPRAVVVDLDNTLHDYKAAARDLRSSLAAHIEQQWGIPRGAVVERYEQLIAAEEGCAFESGRALRLARMRSLLDAWPETRHAEPAPLADFVETTLRDRLRPFEGAIDAYRTISAKVPTMVLTEGYEDTQGAIARHLGLSIEPGAFLATKNSAVRKRDGSAFQLARSRLDVPADEIVVIGDNWSWDIKGAALAGMWQLWVAPETEKVCEPPPERCLGRITAFRDAPAFLSRNWVCRDASPPSCRDLPR